MPRYLSGEASIPETHDLEEVETMLAERMEQWAREHKRAAREEGRKEGLQEGRQKGREEGLLAGQRAGQLALITRQLSRRFGPLPEWVTARLEAASMDQLQGWAEAIFDAGSLEDLFGGE